MNFFVIGFLIMQAASFSLGDELGFAESLGNVEGEPERRRAISYKNGPPPSAAGVMPATQKPPVQHPIPEKRIGARASPNYNAAYRENLKRQVAPTQLMTEARPLPLGVPAFRPIPKTATVPVAQMAQRRTNVAVDSPNPRVRLNNKLVEGYSDPMNSNRTFHVANPSVSQPLAVPAFQAMPNSVARLAAVTKSLTNAEERIMHGQPNYLQFEEPKFDLKDVTVEELASAANVTVDTIKHAIYVREQQMKAEHRAMLAAKLRQEFVRTSTTARTTTTTTPAPLPVAAIKAPVMNWAQPQNELDSQNIKENVAFESKMSKVMNAPREYYPVGYDKNFDDNFKSKVDLPPTSFSCGKQKHFPGLYADTDLGCMVFHVCALTDDGLVRKSFLCPESTLFDQTILKCNWWFYVDCSASKSVYDSNIPISKSYQLMKSLTYFSKYSKNADNEGGDGGLDIQTLKDSMAEEENSRARRVDSDDIYVSDKARSFAIHVEDTTTVATEKAQSDAISPTLETRKVEFNNDIKTTADDLPEGTTEVDIITPQPVYDRLAELKAKLDSIKAANGQTTTQETNEA
uniref:Chitin-binding type-2 domain-containing protein n=1 Tax=Bactrocera latifrons TaxID=174628 RepID=A0A0K8UA16_BACLA